MLPPVPTIKVGTNTNVQGIARKLANMIIMVYNFFKVTIHFPRQ